MGLRHYIVRRLLFLVPTFLGVTVILFVMMHSVGDPVSLMLRGQTGITLKEIESLRQFYGLDKPIWQQYFIWLSKMLRLDLGKSYIYFRPVSEIIGVWLGETLKLQLLSQFLSVMIAIPIGVHSALHQYSKRDMAVTTWALLGVSMPYFWFALLLIIFFAGTLGWFPAFGAYSTGTLLFNNRFLDNLWHMALPVAILTYVGHAGYVRIIRSSMLEILKEDYIIAARSCGLSGRMVIYKYALRNALLPVITFLSMSLGGMLISAPVTETIFSWPGIGYLFIRSLTKFDFPLVIGITVIVSTTVLGMNLVADILYSIVDPRITIE